jgi:hypothetical protein
VSDLQKSISGIAFEDSSEKINVGVREDDDDSFSERG